MKILACLLAATLAASADEAATLKWLSEEHGKLQMAARNERLVEEAFIEVDMDMRAGLWAEPNTKTAPGSGRIWITHWDDSLHRKYLAFAEKRKEMRKTAAAKFVALGNEVKAAGDAEKAALAWRMALKYDAASKEAHERLGEVLVEKQGWYPREEAEKRKKGLLPVGNDWVPAKEAAARHSKWAEAWVVAGEHFEVTSNHSLDGAKNVLARAEEMFHALTRELSEPGAMPVAPDTKGLMKIYYFAARADLDEHNRTAHGDRPGAQERARVFQQRGQDQPLFSSAAQRAELARRHRAARGSSPGRVLDLDRFRPAARSAAFLGVGGIRDLFRVGGDEGRQGSCWKHGPSAREAVPDGLRGGEACVAGGVCDARPARGFREVSSVRGACEFFHERGGRQAP